VVKNVAGYAIHRLLCGSGGGLAVIVEASLKLAPAPASRRALGFDLAPAEIADGARWDWLPRLEPAFATVVGPGLAGQIPAVGQRDGAFTLVVGLEDEPGWVAQQEARILGALGAPRLRLEGDAVVAIVQGLCDLEEQDGPRLSLTTAGNTPAALSGWLDGPAAERLVFHAPAGRLHLFPRGDQEPSLLETAAATGFTLRARRGPGGPAAEPVARAGVRALRGRIRAALDPQATLALGGRWVEGRGQ
jgi:hypothetical protein